jgi:hypothetical protein
MGNDNFTDEDASRPCDVCGVPCDDDGLRMTPPRADRLRPCIICNVLCEDTYKLRCRPCYDKTQDILSINFAIYFNTREYPGKFVVRRWQIEKNAVGPQPYEAVTFDTLAQARASLVPALRRVAPTPATTEDAGDDPSLIETWI